MNERTKSWIKAVLAGVALGVVTLAARYGSLPSSARERRGEPRRPRVIDAGDALLDASGAPDADGDAGEHVGAPHSGEDVGVDPIASRPLAAPRAERFDDDPVAKAACPPGMAFVEGEFCSALSYACVRRPSEASYRCAEYARGSRCFGELDHRRFCVDRWEWPNRVGENPLVYVDWNEARALCSGVGKRLCRRSEWILACEGPKRLPYPWGFVRQPSPCNIDRATVLFDVEAMMNEATREGELARLWQADRIGSHPDCVSAYGAYDLSGNVDEWTDDLADNPSSKHPSTLNGGYWGPVRNTCRLTTTSHGPSFKFYQVGFRCCADTIDGVVVPPPRPFVEREPKKDPSAVD